MEPTVNKSWLVFLPGKGSHVSEIAVQLCLLRSLPAHALGFSRHENEKLMSDEKFNDEKFNDEKFPMFLRDSNDVILMDVDVVEPTIEFSLTLY